MSRRLRTYVHVDGIAYGPDDEVPAAVAKRIGDHAWEDSGAAARSTSSSDDQASSSEPSTSKRPAAKRTAKTREE